MGIPSGDHCESAPRKKLIWAPGISLNTSPLMTPTRRPAVSTKYAENCELKASMAGAVDEKKNVVTSSMTSAVV